MAVSTSVAGTGHWVCFSGLLGYATSEMILFHYSKIIYRIRVPQKIRFGLKPKSLLRTSPVKAFKQCNGQVTPKTIHTTCMLEYLLDKSIEYTFSWISRGEKYWACVDEFTLQNCVLYEVLTYKENYCDTRHSCHTSWRNIGHAAKAGNSNGASSADKQIGFITVDRLWMLRTGHYHSALLSSASMLVQAYLVDCFTLPETCLSRQLEQA